MGLAAKVLTALIVVPLLLVIAMLPGGLFGLYGPDSALDLTLRTIAVWCLVVSVVGIVLFALGVLVLWLRGDL
jgi:hypothetical protein